MMALPYTPGQVTVCYKEETAELADVLDGLPGRPVHAPQPARAGVRRASGTARRLRPGRGRRTAGLTLGHRAGAQGASAPRRCMRGGALPRRGRPVRRRGIGVRVGEERALRRGGLRDRTGDRRHGDAARPRSPCACGCRKRRGRARGQAGAGRPEVRGRSARPPPGRVAPHARSARRRPRGRRGADRRGRGRAGRRRARACPCRTWNAARPRIRRSFAPRSPPASSPVVFCADGGTPAWPRCRTRHVADIRRRRRPRAPGRRCGGRRRLPQRRQLADVRGGRALPLGGARGPARPGRRADEDLDVVSRRGPRASSPPS